MELIAVLAILGVVAAAGLARYGNATLGNAGARSDARRLALDFHQARRRAIASGVNHYISFSPSSGAATQYTIYRRNAGADEAVETTRVVPTSVVLTPSHSEAEFTFEGAALAAYSISVAGPDRTWTVSVIPATGSVQVAESP